MAQICLAIMVGAMLILGIHGQTDYTNWQFIDPRIPKAQALAKFSVLQHSKCANTSDYYAKVMAARQRAMEDTYIWLIVQTQSGTQYEVTIWKYNGVDYPVLDSFKAVQTTISSSVYPEAFIYLDPDDTYAQKIGAFAVQNYNNQTHGNLQYIQLLQADRADTRRGSRFTLIIQTSNGVYEAKALDYMRIYFGSFNKIK